MRMFCTLVLTLVVFFYSIGCSSSSDRNPHREHSHTAPPLREHHTPNRNSTEDPSSRSRSRSPASRPPPIKILGYSLEQLGYIRLIPRTNENRTFEFRNYFFPGGKPISWRTNRSSQQSVRAEEHIVLSASNGDVFAILTNSGILSGIYKSRKHYPRAKINMLSGAVDYLTSDEIRDCPVGKNNPIFPHNFIKAFSESDSLKFKWNFNGDSVSGSSSSARQNSFSQSLASEESLVRARSTSPPDRPPSDHVLGYTMEELGYLRLIPCTNRNQQFEFRRYSFPPDRPIRLRFHDTSYAFEANREYIVFSTSNGDVFAILDYRGTLRGIYSTLRNHERMKINMMSGAVNHMTMEEKRDCPVGKNFPIFPHRFIRAFSIHNSLQSDRNPMSGRNLDSPTSFDDISRSPPGRPPTREVFGYPLSKLGYIRLIPRSNSKRLFEFRRYILPAEKGIRLMLEIGKFATVSTGEHIVLSTSDAEVFAILDYTGIPRGMYHVDGAFNSSYLRIRMNMVNGGVADMTELEMMECPVGKEYPTFPRWFVEVVANEDSLQYLYH